jgi:isopentenyl phosphate kinase
VTGGMKGKLICALKAAEFTKSGFVYITGSAGDVNHNHLKWCIEGSNLPSLRNYSTIVRKSKTLS